MDKTRNALYYVSRDYSRLYTGNDPALHNSASIPTIPGEVFKGGGKALAGDRA